MGKLQKVRSGMSTSKELITSWWQGPYWWLLPVLLLILPAAIIFAVLQAMPLVAPFVYTVF
jgi:hypothetical protein